MEKGSIDEAFIDITDKVIYFLRIRLTKFMMKIIIIFNNVE